MSSDEQKEVERPAEFPVAEVRPTTGLKSILASKMWWVTLVCVIVAVVLAWRSMPAAGPVITIDFPQGHGLKPGDALRHRGIDVGIVQTVDLNSDLGGIQVSVELTPNADVLCREGSRFWIVRPRVGLTGIEGLDTVVGARYIAVSPGAADAADRRRFDGLVSSPPDEFSGDGLELTLRAASRSGLNPGAPITWRGVQVGQVLSVSLSPDARYVNASVRVRGNYRRLVQSTSKFWVTSGVSIHMGLDGIDLSAESLATLALGGVSFITPGSDAGGSDVRSGQVFELHASADPEWMKSDAVIPLVDVELPQTVTVEGSIKTSMLGFSRTKKFTTSGVLLKSGEGVSLLTANVLLQDGEDGRTVPELQVHPVGTGDTVTLEASQFAGGDEASTGLTWLEFPANLAGDVQDRAQAVRSPGEPEACCVTRTVVSDGTPTPMIHSIDFEQLTVRDGVWLVADEDSADLSAWNGAPVVALSDGRIIGLLMTTEQGTAITPIPAE